MGDLLYSRRLERRSTAELCLKINLDLAKNLKHTPTAVVCRLEHLFIDLTFKRLAQLQVAELFKLVQLLYRAARTGLREQEREQPGLEEKRTSRFSGDRKGTTKRRRRAGVKPAASDLLAVEQPRFMCSICDRNAIEVVGLCGHGFCRERQQTYYFELCGM